MTPSSRLYVTCVAALSATAMSLALLWSTVVPMFEAPDEDAHFAYALALARGGMLVRARDGPRGADPQIAAMQLGSDLHRIAFRQSEAAPAGYGSRQFFEALSRRVARTAAVDYRRPGTVRPELMSVYPPGGYVPYAFAIRSSSDLVRGFFAARLASVVMLGATIAMWGCVLWQLTQNRVLGLGVLALVALAPLSSFIGSYVQPDETAALVVPVVLAITLACRRRSSLALVAGYGIALAFLLTIKAQYWFATATGTLHVVLGTKRPIRQTATLVAVPLFAAVTWSLWTTAGTRNGNYLTGERTIWTPLQSALAAGPEATLTFGATWIARMWTDLVEGGTTSLTFWGDFGWIDAPLTTGNGALDHVMQTLEVAGTVITLGFVIVLAALNLYRLVRLVRRGRSVTATRLAAADPVFTSYLVFALLIAFLYVVSANGFGAQGRNWIAFVPVAFLLPVYYAPRTFRRLRYRRLAVGVAATLLAGYAAISPAAALSTLAERYYPNRGPLPQVAALITRTDAADIDIGPLRLGGTAVQRGASVRVVPGQTLEIEGWAGIVRTGRPCRAIYASAGGVFLGYGVYGWKRPDVARATRRPAMEPTGFHFSLTADELAATHGPLLLHCLDETTLFSYAPVAAVRIEAE